MFYTTDKIIVKNIAYTTMYKKYVHTYMSFFKFISDMLQLTMGKIEELEM